MSENFEKTLGNEDHDDISHLLKPADLAGAFANEARVEPVPEPEPEQEPEFDKHLASIMSLYSKGGTVLEDELVKLASHADSEREISIVEALPDDLIVQKRTGEILTLGEIRILKAGTSAEHDSNSIFDFSINEIRRMYKSGEVIDEKTILSLYNLVANEKEEERFNNIPADLKVRKYSGNVITLKEFLDQRSARKEDMKKVEELFKLAKNRDDLETIIRTSEIIGDGLLGSRGDLYTKEELLVLVEGLWKGVVAVDHLPKVAGFRENVFRVMQASQIEDKIPKPMTWDEMKGTLGTSENSDEGGSVQDYKDSVGNLVHEYDPALVRTKPTTDERTRFRGFVEKVASFFKKNK